MEWTTNNDEIFVRLDPGERLVESLSAIAAEASVSTAAITSGVGMLSSAELGFFMVPLDDYERKTFEGI